MTTPIELPAGEWLSAKELLGQGGFGKVWRLHKPPIPGRVVYKEFTGEIPQHTSVLRRMVAHLAGLSGSGRRHLLAVSSWPLAVIVSDDRILGYILEEIKADFYSPVPLLDQTRTVPNEIQHLLGSATYERRRFGLVTRTEQRLVLLSSAASNIAFLHAMGVVVGDLSPRNLLFSRDRGRTYFTDTDGFVFRGSGFHGVNVETPEWSIRQLLGRDEPASPATDSYKFALLVLRLINRNSRASSPQHLALPFRDERLEELLRRSLSFDPEVRPTISSWREALSSTRRALASADRPQANQVVPAFDQSPTNPMGHQDTARSGPTSEQSLKEETKLSRPAGFTEPPLSFLLLGTEWTPGKGGLSQFNRSLAIELARLGHKVYCAVLHHTFEDDLDAESHGIELIRPEIVPGYSDLHIRPLALAKDRIDVVIGHDRFTGMHAVTQARQNFPGSTLVVVAHTVPEELEWQKGRVGATGRAEERQGLLRSVCLAADVRCGVGPRLQRSVASLLFDGYSRPEVIRLDPGLGLDAERPAGRTRGPELGCLLLGRAEDPELKGFDLGADAFAALPSDLKAQSRLIIRGADPNLGDELHRRLTETHGINRSDCWVRPFDVTPGTVRRDLLQAAVLLMPSRGEGFGLVGIEAVAVGTPILVSSRSGLAELIAEVAPDIRNYFVVDVDDRLDADHARWREALVRVLSGSEQHFSAVLDLWDRLQAMRGWQRSAEALVSVVRHARSRDATNGSSRLDRRAGAPPGSGHST